MWLLARLWVAVVEHPGRGGGQDSACQPDYPPSGFISFVKWDNSDTGFPGGHLASDSCSC